MLPGDNADLRKQRGAFFTPYEIAEYLADWAIRGQGNSGLVLDPTCGEGVFLLAAAARLREQGRTSGGLFGVDIHAASLQETKALLREHGSEHESQLLTGDFFDEPSPDQLGGRLPLVDAVIGNPPFVRYQEHRGAVRKQAAAAALSQGVRLSGLASSWAALLVHSSAFLKPDGRIAMVLPAELLSVGYAEPVRQWLKRRFASVHLVLFEHLQFADAEEQVVLLVARGAGGCDAFTLHQVQSAADLPNLHIFDAAAFAPQSSGKWTDLLLPQEARGALREVVAREFAPLSSFGRVELGTVTGANSFFTMSEATRRKYDLRPGVHVEKCAPAGTRHLPGLTLTIGQWEQLRLKGERVWMLNPNVSQPRGGFGRYVARGEDLEVHKGYKCGSREPWWRPPVVSAPDLFFTYMSHVAPRLIQNEAGVTFVNSMHGVRLHGEVSPSVRFGLPFLALNTVTMLAAEIYGRAYGGGILKMEPREAGRLPLPGSQVLETAWGVLAGRRASLESMVRSGDWASATTAVDAAVIDASPHLTSKELEPLQRALSLVRRRRQGKPG